MWRAPRLPIVILNLVQDPLASRPPGARKDEKDAEGWRGGLVPRLPLLVMLNLFQHNRVEPLIA
jgi:hypothetical protein